MNDWKEVRLGDVVNFEDGDRGKNYPKQSEYLSKGHCLFLNTSNVTKEGFNFDTINYISKEKDLVLRNGRLKNEDIVLTTRGTIGNLALYNKNMHHPMRINSSMLIIRTKNNIIIPQFIYYFFKLESMQEYFTLYSSGSAQPQLPIKDLRNIKFKIPNLEIQNKIAEVLTTYDDLIENNKRKIEILEESASELYKEWFVRMRFPGYKETKFKKGIPENWKFDKLINNQAKLVPVGIMRFHNEKTYLATADVNNLDIIGGEAITFEDRPLRANMQPKENTIWFAKMQDSIKHLYFKEYSTEAINNLILSTGFAGIEFKELDYFYYYLSYIRYGLFEEVKDMYANGSTQVAINNQNLKRLGMLIPTKNILIKFNEVINKNFKLIEKLRIQNQNLIKQRDMLLPRLMNGTIKVK